MGRQRLGPVLLRRDARWLMIGGLVLLNFIMITVGVQSLVASRERTIQQVRDTTSMLAAVLEHDLASKVRNIDHALLNIADALIHLEGHQWETDAEIEKILATHRQHLPEVDAFRLSDADGFVRWGTDVRRNDRVSWSNREDFIEHKARTDSRLIIGEPRLSPISKIWVITLTRPFIRRDGSFGGMIRTGIPLDELRGMLSKLELGPHGSAVIRHENHALVTRSPPVEGPGGEAGNKKVSEEFRQLVAAGVDSSTFHTLNAPDGYERTYAFRRIAGLPLILTVGMAPEDYLAPWKTEARHTILLLLGFFVATLLLMWLIRHYWRAQIEQSEFLHSLIDAIPIPVFFKGIDGYYLGCNQAFEKLLGKPRDEIIGRTTFDLAPTELAHRYQAMDQELFDNPGAQRYEWQTEDSTEERRNVIFHKATFKDSDGEVAGLIGAITDITEQKRYEERLEHEVELRTMELKSAKEAAESASRAKSTFLANMSHELRTPMNAIMGMTTIALRTSNDPRLQDQLGKIGQASRHLLNVINDILDISKIEADRLVLEQADFRVGKVIDSLVGMMGQRAADKGLRLTVDLAPCLANMNLKGDRLRLEQVLLNLVGNAIKFTEQGEIRISASLEEDAAEAVSLRFAVADSGIGIAPEIQARLFTAFEQADSSMTRKYGGTGLGLAICKRLVELMGGEIGVTSTPAQGSTFWFRVRLQPAVISPAPASGPAARPESAEARLRQEHGGAPILVAEDEPINREVAVELLEAAGLAVDTAEDGQIAVELARHKRYHLILMDMQMPQLTGIEATRIIRADSLNRDTPIVAMTANAFEDDRQACLAAGMDDHIGKPVNPDILFRTLLARLAIPRSGGSQ